MDAGAGTVSDGSPVRDQPTETAPWPWMVHTIHGLSVGERWAHPV